jgi:phage terminase large subunit
VARLIELPYRPRPWQRRAWELQQRFNVLVWHRRAGKTVHAIAWLCRKVMTCQLPAPRGAYLAPQYKQAKRVAWSLLKQHLAAVPGVRFIENDLVAMLPGERQIWLLGAENPDALRGIYLDAAVLDEVPQMHPRTWGEVVRPLLADRGGAALMIGTPFGPANQFARFYELAGGLSGWWRDLMTVDDSQVLPVAEVEALRREMAPSEFDQEFMCSFTAALRGAYFGPQMEAAEREGRITAVPHDPLLPVHTSWDLGLRNLSVVWCWQTSPAAIRAIRCLAFQGTPLPDIIAELGRLPYSWGTDYVPHDAKVEEYQTGQTRIAVMRRLGRRPETVPDIGLRDGIDAARNMIPRVWFDREGCGDGIQALQLYRSEYDGERQVFSERPLKDWTTDYADAFRMFAVMGVSGYKGRQERLDYSRLDRVMGHG